MTTEALHLGVPLAQAKAVCVFVHGRGQSPEAMEAHVIRRLAAPGIAHVLPRAANGSWYAAKAVDPLTDATRASLNAALDGLRQLVSSLPPSKPVLLAGFSQGACVALEYAMRFGPWAGSLAILTGCRVGVKGDARPMSDLGGMPVYMTGSDADSWIPVSAWADAAEALGNARAALRMEIFPGRAHQVGDAEIAVIDAMLARL